MSGFLAGSAYAAIAIAGLVALLAPGRFALATWQANLGRPRGQTFASGLAHDVFDTAAVLGTLAALPLLVPERWRTRPAVRALYALTPLAALVFGFSGSSFAEFAIQRGTFPTWFDFQGGLRDSNFATSAVRVFLYPRHAVPIAIGLAVFFATLPVWRRAIARTERHPRDLVLAGSVGTTCLLAALFGMPNLPQRGWFPAIGDGNVTGAPFHTFFLPLGGDLSNVRFGVMGLIQRGDFPPEHDANAAKMLGLPPSATTAPSLCSVHPFRRPLPSDDPGAPELVRAFTRLSTILFASPRPPSRILHFVLESFRGEDVRALNPRASSALAPATSRLIDEAQARRSADLTIPMLFQAGSRSSQGLTALMCGFGTLGFNLSASRDLGALPLRCVPDVFADAGIGTHYLYGAELSFDGVDDFLRLHGIRDIRGDSRFPADLPRGGWGISDLALLDQVFKLVATTPAVPLAWWVVPTLTHHAPFGAPDDLPEEVRLRVDRALEDRPADSKPARKNAQEERDRVTTFSYTDFFVERALAHVAALGDEAETLAIFHADHATADLSSWDPHSASKLRPKAQIPFVLHVPDALVRAHNDPATLRAALDDAQRALSEGPISQNDLPTLLLALVSASAPLRALPEAGRWHTLGGQRTSPHWSAPTRPGAAVIGLNAVGEFFAVDPRGETLGPLERVEQIAAPEDVTNDRTEIRPTAGLFSRFLQDWAQRCPAPASVRMPTGNPP